MGRKKGTGSADSQLLRLGTVLPSPPREPGLLCSTEKPPFSSKGFFWRKEGLGLGGAQKPFDPQSLSAETKALCCCPQQAQCRWGRASPEAEGTKGSEMCAGSWDWGPPPAPGGLSHDPLRVSLAHPAQEWETSSCRSKSILPYTSSRRGVCQTFSVERQVVHCQTPCSEPLCKPVLDALVALILLQASAARGAQL